MGGWNLHIEVHQVLRLPGNLHFKVRHVQPLVPATGGHGPRHGAKLWCEAEKLFVVSTHIPYSSVGSINI